MNSFGTSPLELMACDAMLNGLVYMDEFTYSAAFITGTSTALASGGTTDVQIQINSDSDFIAQAYNLAAWSAAGTLSASPDILITLIRAGSGREIFNQAQSSVNIAGNYGQNKFPGFLPVAALYQANSTVTVRLTDRQSQNWNRVDFAMRGFKVFYQTNAKGETGNRRDIFHAL